MNPQAPKDPNRIDLSSINQQPKQKRKLSLPNFLKRKKSAGPGRDHLGQFSSGSSGLKAVKKFNWARALPLILVIAGVGGYLVFRSFAGTYTLCRSSNGDYTEECLVNSDEARVVRLYYGILNRAPDFGGLNYWKRRVEIKGTTRIAAEMMGSREFARRYGSLNNADFVRAMYPQVFGRAPDTGGLNYWTRKLDAGLSRARMIVFFTESSEAKRDFMGAVLRALNLETSNLAGYPKDIVTDGGGLNIMSYNILKGGQKKDYDPKPYAELIYNYKSQSSRNRSPDIIFIQETYSDHIGLLAQDLEDLYGKTIYYRFAPAHPDPSDDVLADDVYTGQYGHAILSVYPIISSAVVELPYDIPGYSALSEKRVMLDTSIDVDGVGVRAVGVHFTNDDNERSQAYREAQSEYVRDYLAADSSDKRLLIFAGDLNTSKNSLPAFDNLLLLPSNLPTIPAGSPTRQYDYAGYGRIQRNWPPNFTSWGSFNDAGNGIKFDDYSDHRPQTLHLNFTDPRV